MGQNNANPSAQPPGIMDFLRSISDPARTGAPGGLPYQPVATPQRPIVDPGFSGMGQGPTGVPQGFNGAAVGAQRGSQIGMARANPITGPLNPGNSSNPASGGGEQGSVFGTAWRPRL